MPGLPRGRFALNGRADRDSEHALLRAHELVVRFGGEAVVDTVDLELARGEIVTLVGPNGSGKTTLVRAAIGLLRADAGRIWRRSGLRLGYVPQQIQIDATLPISAERFVALSGAPPRVARAALDRTAAGALAASPLGALSGGELRRVLLARALARRPELLVLDEPTAGVDVTGQGEVYQLIDDIRREYRCGVLLVSHDLHLVMARTDRVLCLNRHVCCSGTPEHISTHPEYLALFGDPSRTGLAVYTHQHDHEHDLRGHVSAAPPDSNGG